MKPFPLFLAPVFGFYSAPSANTRNGQKRLSGLVWGCQIAFYKTSICTASTGLP